MASRCPPDPKGALLATQKSKRLFAALHMHLVAGVRPFASRSSDSHKLSHAAVCGAGSAAGRRLAWLVSCVAPDSHEYPILLHKGASACLRRSAGRWVPGGWRRFRLFNVQLPPRSSQQLDAALQMRERLLGGHWQRFYTVLLLHSLTKAQFGISATRRCASACLRRWTCSSPLARRWPAAPLPPSAAVAGCWTSGGRPLRSCWGCSCGALPTTRRTTRRTCASPAREPTSTKTTYVAVHRNSLQVIT